MTNKQVVLALGAAAVLGLVVGKIAAPRSPKADDTEAPGDRRPAPRAPPPHRNRDNSNAPATESARAAALTPPPRAPSAPEGERKQVGLSADDAAIGPADARVTVVEFSDFQCPYCAKVEPTIKRIRDDYSGAVRVVFKHFPLPFHKDASLAAQAAIEAQKQGKFWEFHDRIYADNHNLSRADLERQAEAVGLDLSQFRNALDTGVHTKEIQRDMEEGKALGVNGTPAFFINGKPLTGAQPYERFKNAIDAELGR